MILVFILLLFPSITLASWASIFTGKEPKDTGQLGNEFFDRSLASVAGSGIPQEGGTHNPSGVVSYSSGSFPGYDALGLGIVWTRFVPPMKDGVAASDITIGALASESAQNEERLLRARTVYEWLSSQGKESVVQSNHYARGASLWLTHYESLAGNVGAAEALWGAGATSSKLLDGISLDITRKYLDKRRDGYLRGDKRFPALWVYYVAGLDHDGHVRGISQGGPTYQDMFRETTDKIAIGGFVDKLKEIGEFYNKVFLVTSDHGHTEMAAPASVVIYAGTPDERSVAPDVSCSYKLKGFNKQGATRDAELANNNLHVWELGEVLKWLQTKVPDRSYRVLAPPGIGKLFKNSPAGARDSLSSANVVAALNGPMAHVYLNSGGGWEGQPDANELLKLAGVFDLLFRGRDASAAEAAIGIDPVDFLDMVESTVGRLSGAADQIFVRVAGTYYLFPGYDANGQMQSLTGVDLDAGTYVKAQERIQGMNHPDRSGDIVLLFKSDVSDIQQRYTSGVSCKSWHGSLNRTDSYVPFILSYPGGNAAELDKPIEDVCPGKQCMGNWKATDLIKKIVETQYSGQ